MLPPMKRYARTDDGYALVQDDGNAVLLDRAPWLGEKPTGRRVALASGHLRFPVGPTKIPCIGRNYRAHAAELGHDVPTEPLVFLKPPSALLDPGGTVLLPPESTRVEHEAELGVVIGKRCRRVPPERALDFVFGYTVVCDVTARDLQKKDGQWSRAKGFDTFCPVGPYVVTGVDPAALGIRLRVGEALRQDGNTRDMIFDIARVVSHVSQAMTLLPGDLIATGTPEGVGPLAPGDHVAVEIDELGTLEFNVAAEQT